MEVTAFIIELSAEVVKGIQGGNECWMGNNEKLRGEGRRDGCAFERVGADAKQQSVHLKARVIVQGNGIVVLLQWLWEWRGSVRRKAIPPVVARIFSGDSTSPLTRDGHGCPKLNAQSFKHGRLKSATQSRYARMHKDSHTKPLHDATAQMAVDAQMQRHKWLTRHGCETNRAFIWQECGARRGIVRFCNGCGNRSIRCNGRGEQGK